MRRRAARTALGLAAWLIALLSIAAGTGVLYLLRGAGALGGGPGVGQALGLQQLAGDAAQPLARVAFAFAGAGVAAGLAFALLTRLRALSGALIAAATCWLLGIGTGAAADAIAQNVRYWPRLAPQLGRQASWVTAGIVLVATFLTMRAARAFAAARSTGAAPAPRPGGEVQRESNAAATRAHARRATIAT